jgi:hypothetical protein
MIFFIILCCVSLHLNSDDNIYTSKSDVGGNINYYCTPTKSNNTSVVPRAYIIDEGGNEFDCKILNVDIESITNDIKSGITIAGAFKFLKISKQTTIEDIKNNLSLFEVSETVSSRWAKSIYSLKESKPYKYGIVGGFFSIVAYEVYGVVNKYLFVEHPSNDVSVHSPARKFGGDALKNGNKPLVIGGGKSQWEGGESLPKDEGFRLQNDTKNINIKLSVPERKAQKTLHIRSNNVGKKIK